VQRHSAKPGPEMTFRVTYDVLLGIKHHHMPTATRVSPSRFMWR
jgi:hypothetical protein